jgi:hypothetical protein
MVLKMQMGRAAVDECDCDPVSGEVHTMARQHVSHYITIRHLQVDKHMNTYL